MTDSTGTKQASSTTLHTKYRPSTLDSIIGHETAVTRLKGMVAKGNVPGALLFVGPPSVGKTTLARALAHAINGKHVDAQIGDYKELNAAEQRSIEDMRELIRTSKYRPQGKKKIFVIDEAQALLTNAVASQCLDKDTTVLTDRGALRAEVLFGLLSAGEAVKAASYNTKTRLVEYKDIEATRKMESVEAETVFAHAKITANHLVYVPLTDEYVRADSVMEKPVLTLKHKWDRAVS